MRALTVKQPWAWAILHAGKRIENRSRKPPEWAIGTVIALHAGQSLDESGVVWLRRRGFAVPDDLPRGVIAGSMRITGVIEKPIDDIWWQGPVGWSLDNVTPLPEPIPCSGQLGLWSVPDELAKLIDNK
ncbi:MAG TPA: hypothetical protein VMX35_13575 [Acidobacteriota bacterium]|nr:hypothetical protein [Acidobacteriota bacterium]